MTKIIPKGKIDFEGIKKVGRGSLIAGSGAVLTYLVEAIPGIDFGSMTPVIMAVFSIGINFLKKLLTNYKSK